MDIKLKRFRDNPILAPTNNTWENKAVFNCGATIFDEKILLLYRAYGDDMISRFGLAFSDDGYHITERLPNPVFEPDPDTQYEELGVEDPRITKIDGTYYIVYTAASFYPSIADEGAEKRPSGELPWRVRVSLAHTHDFKTFTKHGVIISHIDSKDAVLFPKRFKNQLLLYHRVIPDIRLAVATDTGHFLERGPVLSPGYSYWDEIRVGTGAPPIETPYGWVLIYHGVDARERYSLGLALIDKQNPLRVIRRSRKPVLEPEKEYEKVGLVDNVVFSCGAVVKDSTLFVYYGAADSTIGVASIEFDRIVTWARWAAKSD